jgi:hypothetical protein
MVQVSQLCTKGVLLDGGRVTYSGGIKDTIFNYLSTTVKGNIVDVDSLPRMGYNSDVLRIKSLKLATNDDLKILTQHNVSFEFTFEVSEHITELVIGFSLTDFFGNNVVECRSTSTFSKLNIGPGVYKSNVEFKPNISPGIYNLNLGARSLNGRIEFVPSVLTLDIFSPETEFEEWNKPSAGIVIVDSEWELQKQ